MMGLQLAQYIPTILNFTLSTGIYRNHSGKRLVLITFSQSRQDKYDLSKRKKECLGILNNNRYQCSVSGIKNKLTTKARPHSIPTIPKFVFIDFMILIHNKG
jgi:hypothetical protein